MKYDNEIPLCNFIIRNWRQRVPMVTVTFHAPSLVSAKPIWWTAFFVFLPWNVYSIYNQGALRGRVVSMLLTLSCKLLTVFWLSRNFTKVIAARVSRLFQKISQGYRRFPKTVEDFRRLTKRSDHCRRWNTMNKVLSSQLEKRLLLLL